MEALPEEPKTKRKFRGSAGFMILGIGLVGFGQYAGDRSIMSGKSTALYDSGSKIAKEEPNSRIVLTPTISSREQSAPPLSPPTKNGHLSPIPSPAATADAVNHVVPEVPPQPRTFTVEREMEVNYTIWLNVDPSKYLHENWSLGTKKKGKLLFRYPFHFRMCRNENGTSGNTTSSLPVCPDPNLNPPAAAQDSVFQRHLSSSWIVYMGRKAHPVIGQNQIVSASFWSAEFKQEIALHLKEIIVRSCVGGECPHYCHDESNASKFPYGYDPSDFLCKSSSESLNGCNCESTCFTPRAVIENRTFPWKSRGERDLFLPTTAQEKAEKQVCAKIWSGKQKEDGFDYRPRFDCDLGKNTSDTDGMCSYMDSFTYLLLYVPEAKLVFCGIPKGGITEWIKFIRYVFGAGDYLSHPHYKRDWNDFTVRRLTPARAQEILTDPEWTKAVFFREPAERLLSAYLDKIAGRGANKGVPASREQFTKFVDRVSRKSPEHQCGKPGGIHVCTDPHWRPQTLTGGLDYILPYFNFIGNMKHIGEHTQLLLEKVGLWEKYGSTFDDGQGVQDRGGLCGVPPPNRPANFTPTGFNQRGVSGVGKNKHSTGSSSKMAEFYTTELLKKVREAYYLDYAVWDQIKDLPPETILSGLDLNVVQEYCGNLTSGGGRTQK